jgi:beta-glucosidase
VAELSRRLTISDMSHARLVFVGDSIFDGWQADIYRQFYGHRAPVNLSIAGDITQGVLWRLSPRRATGADQAGGGQWPSSLKPRLAVVLLGTNNMVQNRDATEVALGIAEVVRLIHRRSPTTRVLLVGLLPRGADSSDPMRALAQRVNEQIARCADNTTVFYTNPGPMLVDGQGRLAELIAPDRLHPSWIGYAILAAALEPQIRQLLAD